MLILFIGVLMLSGALCDDDRNYNVRVQKMECSDKTSDFFSNANMTLTAYNDSATTISAFAILVKEIPETAYCTLTGFEQNSQKNGYQATSSFSKSAGLCDFLEKDEIVMKELRKYSNLPEACPIPMQPYFVNTYLMEAEGLPNRIPGQDHWKFVLKVYPDNDTTKAPIAEITVYIYFEPK